MNAIIRSFSNRTLFQSVMLTVVAFLLINAGLALTASAGQAAKVAIEPGGILVTPMVPGVTFMMFRVADPQGLLIFDKSSNGIPIKWSPPAEAQEGTYTWEVRVGFGERNRTRDNGHQTDPPSMPWRQSGTVFIKGGGIVPPSLEETSILKNIFSVASAKFAKLMDLLVTSAYADVLHYDDVIITGSLGVGSDSADGQNFGFDTIQLKENNLRIYFDDTSNTSSFPSNDWRIIINDNTDGGASYFAIEDSTAGRVPFKIEAGAPANSLYIEDYGHIGIGTALPAVELHIADSDTPSVRLEQDQSGGWAPQTWDLAGNETNFFIRDVTNGSKLPFKIKPGAPTDSLFIKNDGKVGVGTGTPTEALHVEGNAYVSANLELGSSRAYKESIHPLGATEAIKTLMELQPVKYRYKSDPDEESLGFIAEDVPDLVATNNRKTLSPMDLVALLTRVLQEQEKVIEGLSQKVIDLEKEIKFGAQDTSYGKDL